MYVCKSTAQVCCVHLASTIQKNGPKKTHNYYQTAAIPMFIWWTPAADLGRAGILSSEICNLSYLQKNAHSGARFLSQYWVNPYLHHCQHTELYSGVWKTFIFLIEEFGSCLVHHTCIASLGSSCKSWYNT